VITRRTVVFLGLSQLVCWGVSFYLIGVFGDRIAADLGWSHTVVFGGYSTALLTMGLVSPVVGRMIDRFGGGHVMAAGSVLCAAGCTMLAAATAVTTYYAAWLCLGVAMRAILYDAAFATLARIGGAAARRPIAQITLLGGLASTCFWPIGHLLADALGWRGALAVYAVFALLTAPLHLAMPRNRHDAGPAASPFASASAAAPRPGNPTAAAWLYALIVALANGLNSGMSAHMIGVLADLGIAAGLAVTVSALRGIGQSAARLAEVLFGGRLSPAQLNLAAAFVLPAAFAVGLASGVSLSAAVAFALFYGAGNGILTITRGTLPLVLFDIATYGAVVGRLLVPAFLFSAAAPLLFAAVIEHAGARGALLLALAFGAVILVASLLLLRRARVSNDPACPATGE